ncbi:unnamed protein product [Cuscuta epithymum]|uniref:Gag1-like clamp domain-containing protein n=1 Tax=Cuscuta epithymum TaxID=186058 RepID=A0AAV0GAW0_9ASTE|nr:unnamed protein product [Cuscuta epithymum]
MPTFKFFYRSVASWFARIFTFMGGFFGCCTKPTIVISVEDRSKGLKSHGQQVRNTRLREDFWSSSTCEMDNSAFQSHRSASSISTSNNTHDPSISSTGNISQSEFVNNGLMLWKQTRQQWIGNTKSQNHVPANRPKLSFEATYENLLGTNKQFPRPIPLPEMVDFLVDIWEQEGLYD